MPQTITDADGNEVEVFTAEELEAQKQAALEEFQNETQSAVTEKNLELESAKKELADAKDLLDKAAEKDLNFAKLRRQKEEAQEKVDELNSEKSALQEEMEAKLGEFKQEVLEGVRKDFYNETLESLAGGDEELKKKIEFEYNRLKDSVTTNEEISKKLRDAYTLATPAPQDVAAPAFSSAGVSRPPRSPRGDLPKEAVELGKKLGLAGGMQLKDEDFN